MIGFYHGSSLPAKENLKSGIYFIVEEGNKGKLYRVLADGTDGVLIAETNNDTEFASLKAAVEQAQKDIVKNAGDVATILAGLTKITEKHGAELENITTEAASIRELAQGAADQAALNKAAHEKNAGDIKTNADAISAMKADATIVTFKGIEKELAGKEAAGVAQNLVSAAKTELQGYADAAAKAVDDKLGFTPDESNATLKAYVDEKTKGIATEGAIAQLGERVAAIEEDYLTSVEEKELTDAIALKADQTALTAEADRAKGEEARIEGLVGAEETRAKGEEARIEGLVTAEAAKAREEEGKLSDRLDEVEAFFNTTEEEKLDEALDTLIELQKYLETEGAAAEKMVLDIKANADAIDAIEADYLKAADKTELSGAIDGVEGRMDTAEGKISALEAKFGEGEGSVEDMIADAVAAEAALRETGVNEAKAAAKAADDKAVAAQGEVDALEGVVAGKAAQSDLEALQGRVKTVEDEITTASTGLKARMTAAEGEIDALQAELETPSTGIKAKLAAVEIQASNNKAAIESNDSDIAALMAALEWKQA